MGQIKNIKLHIVTDIKTNHTIKTSDLPDAIVTMSRKLLVKSLQLVEGGGLDTNGTPNTTKRKNLQEKYSRKEKRKRKAAKQGDVTNDKEDLFNKNLQFFNTSRELSSKSSTNTSSRANTQLDTKTLLGFVVAKRFRDPVVSNKRGDGNGKSDFDEGDFDFSDDDDEDGGNKKREPVY